MRIAVSGLWSEALNESITGDAWPPKPIRNARLEQAARTMRALWAGETVSHEGYSRVKEAHVYSRPARPPMLIGAAISAKTARWVASWADALITVADPGDRMRAVVDAFREGGGAEKPMFLQVTLSFATTDDEAAAAAHDQWRQCVLLPEQLADLATPAEFDRAAANFSRSRASG
jgi:coenzyme F420-dependent glucose-6-phosphate dehydrogenase